MNMAQLKTDTQDGASAAKAAVQDMSHDMRGSITEARGSLALLGEEFGVHIPRHLQTFIAELPGVGTALNAAFSSVAIIALVELLVKAAQQIEAFRAKAQELKDAMAAAGDAGKDSLHKLDEELLNLRQEFDTITGDQVGAFLIGLQKINNASLDKLAEQLKTVGKSLDDLLEKQKDPAWLGWLRRGNSDISDVIKQFDAMKKHLEDLKDAGDIPAYGKALAEDLKAAQAGANVQGYGLKDLATAWGTVVARLQDLQKEYVKTAEVGKQATENDFAKHLKDELAEDAQAAGVLAKAMATVTPAVPQDAFQKINTDLASAVAAVDKFAAANKDYWTAEQQADIKAQLAGQARINQLNAIIGQVQQLTQLQTRTPVTLPVGPTNSVFQAGSGSQSSDQANLQEVQKDGAAAEAAARKVADATETANQKFQEQAALLVTLYNQGRLTDTELAKGLQQAQAAAEPLNKEYERLGQEIGKLIISGKLFSSQWESALRSLGIQFAEVIVQVTLLKTLTDALGSTGAGGFFSSILTGIVGGHRAEGGPVKKGTIYPVGEKGPELFAPGMSGSIIPNGAWGGGRYADNRSVNVHQTVVTPDANSFQRSQRQLNAQAFRDGAAAHARMKG